MTREGDVRAAWLAQLKNTTAADRPRAEEALRRLYRAAGFTEPQFIFWHDSPCAAAWAVAVLIAEGNRVWAPLLAHSALSREDRDRADSTRSRIIERVGVASWGDAVSTIGVPRIGTLQMMPDASRLFSSALMDARFGLVDDVSALFTVRGDEDDLTRAESHLHGGNLGALTSALHCSATGSVIGNSFFGEYSIASMATDEERVGSREVPPVLASAWDVARSAGLFWPFENAAILSDRPTDLYFNERHLLHRDEGPAAVYRDGWRVFAWNGKAVPERWIMEPGAVPSREYKGFDPTFAKFAQSKAKPGAAAKKQGKRASVVSVVLPADPVARLEQLRKHAGGTLPLFDRYQRGEHRQVWNELLLSGAAVREDPLAADALAVAYETMGRVRENVRTLVQRLTAIGYVFTPDGPQGSSLLSGVFGALMKGRPRDQSARAHVLPGPAAAQDVARFEKEFGTLPLSLRAFHEVVGEVNLTGRHPTIDPPNNPTAPDPLLVYGLDEGIVEFDEEDEDAKPSAVTIAPDDLHKANTSGGDAYEMAIPDLRADGELLNERHQLFFVDYLRLAFQFGGFPGYEGQAQVPAELRSLGAGLLDF